MCLKRRKHLKLQRDAVFVSRKSILSHDDPTDVTRRVSHPESWQSMWNVMGCTWKVFKGHPLITWPSWVLSLVTYRWKRSTGPCKGYVYKPLSFLFNLGQNLRQSGLGQMWCLFTAFMYYLLILTWFCSLLKAVKQVPLRGGREHVLEFPQLQWFKPNLFSRDQSLSLSIDR